ncbi:MAG TPA: cytochrome c oxidase assembly protein [Sphingomonadales bacterium]|nr:cytochrome c oxidase assembly protein [Sphingomonadales bacterium]
MSVAAKNRRTLGILAGVAAGMVALSFAAVPLYRIFCQVTGFGGTVREAKAAQTEAAERAMRIRFTASVDKDMPWEFKPAQLSEDVRIGETRIAAYEAFNPTDRVVTGTAVFNVTPHKAGPYFGKIECFCFTEQTLQPGERKTMPVMFFVDPAIAGDKNLDDVKEIVLSYTFYLSHSEAAETAAAQYAADDPFHSGGGSQHP